MRRAALIGGAAVALTALVLVALLVAEGLLFDSKPAFSEKWVECATGESCVAVAVPCGWTAVNRRHRNPAEAYYAYIATVVELRCRSEDVPAAPPPAACRTGRCTFDQTASP